MLAFSVIAGILLLLVLLVSVGRDLVKDFLKLRGNRVIVCPENHIPAGVRLDAPYVWFATLEGKPQLRLSSCSRWPERKNCGQDCLLQIATAPEDCLVRNILARWYERKLCALCGKPVGDIDRPGQAPALLDADHKTVSWREVAPEQVPSVCSTHRPVCWHCHVVNSMVVEHPELVVNRARSI